MKSLNRLFAIVLFLSCSTGLTTQLHAQSVLVSEYYNMADPANGEWHEIIVVQDNLDMRGMIVSDNNTDQSLLRTGGVRCKNVDFWKNLRAGTIIGIWHRDYPTNSLQDADTIMSDGRIMLAANDTRYFDHFSFDARPWNTTCFNLSRTGDFIEVFTKDTVHIHAIGHKVDVIPGPYWFNMPAPKCNILSLCEDTWSNRVTPGASLADYNGPNQEVRSQACSRFVTRTLPNKDCSTGASNAAFWHSLRQPTWTNPTVQTTLSANQVMLSWNTMLDPLPSDGVQGYLVVRDSGSTPFVPVDGRVYTTNERVGSAVVLANLGSQITSFADNIDLPCGVIYTYRVFAYRFAQDDEFGVNTVPSTTRGRQYNVVSYGFHEALKQAGVGPKLQYTAGQNVFCEGSSLTISVPAQSGYSAQWMLNGAAINGETGFSVVARNAGQYRLKLTNSQGCLVLSDSVDVTVNPLPTVDISPRSLSLCTDSSSLLQASINADYNYQWYLNSTIINGATDPNYLAQQAGDYTVKVTNKLSGCVGTSGSTTIKAVAQQFSSSTNTLVFADLADCVSFADNNNSIVLSNPSATDTLVLKALEPSHFSVVSPAFPLSLAPGKSATVTVRFTPNSNVLVSEDMSFVTVPCGVTQKVALKARKPGLGVGLSSDVSNKDFGTIAWCASQSRKDTVFLSVTQATTVSSITVDPPFFLNAADKSGFVMNAGDKRAIEVTFNSGGNPLQVGKKDMVVNFTAGACTDSIKVNLRGTFTLPQLLVDLASIDFGQLDSCHTISRDTVIKVSNTSAMDIELKQLTDPGVSIVEIATSGPLTIPAGTTVQLTLRFSPNSFSNYSNKQISLQAKGCLDPSGFNVSGYRSGIAVSAVVDSLDFGDLNSCNGISAATKSAGLIVTSLNLGNAIVSDVRFSSTLLQSDLKLNQTLVAGTNSFNISTNPNANAALGRFKEYMYITLQPCDVQQRIVITGNVVGQSVTIDKSALKDTLLDFGTVDIGSSGTQTYTLRNNSSVAVTLGSVPIKSGMFDISTQPAAGSVIAPGQTIVVTVVFNPTASGNSNALFSIPISAPCTDSLKCQLFGIGRTKGTNPSELHFEIGNHSASVGDVIDIPVNVQGSQVAGRALTELHAVFAYNTSLLKINNVTAGPALAGFTSSFSTVQNGVMLNATNGSVLADTGRAFNVNATVLLGDALSTPLFIDTSSVSLLPGELVSASPKNGSLTIVGSCKIGNRTVKLNGAVGLGIVRQSSSSGIVCFGYETVGEQTCSMEVYNSLGEQVRTLVNTVCSAGAHEVELDTQTLGQGNYFVVLNSGISHHSLLISIVR